MTVQVPTSFNPSDKGSSIVLGNANRTVSGGSSGSVRSRTKVSSGKWYFEITRTHAILMFGVGNASMPTNTYPGSDATSIGVYGGSLYVNGSTAEYVSALNTTGVFGVELDADARTVRIFNAGASSTHFPLPFSGDIYIVMGVDGGGGGGGNGTLNAAHGAFTYSVPSGCTPGFALIEAYAVAGNVKDASGANVARKVQALLRSTGALVAAATSDASTGDYLLIPEPNTTAEVIVLALPVSTSENALILDRVVPA